MTSTDPNASNPSSEAAPQPAEPFPAEGRRLGRGHITSYEDGRRCSTAGCDTVLSRYNAKRACAVHSMTVGNTLAI